MPWRAGLFRDPWRCRAIRTAFAKRAFALIPGGRRVTVSLSLNESEGRVRSGLSKQFSL